MKISTTYPLIEEDDIQAVTDTMRSTFITQGKKTKEFEEAFAALVEKKYAVALNSGTSANFLMFDILMRTGKLKQGDEVLTTALTWVTSVAPIVHYGLIPVFADINEDFTMKFDEKLLSPKTKAVLAVHLLGFTSKDQFPENLIKIEDSCESVGSKNCGYGLMTSYSFFASHHITTAEGGMLTTDDKSIYEMARKLREFGRAYPGQGGTTNFLFDYLGFNYKYTDLQASLGLSQLKKFKRYLAQRHANARVLSVNLSTYKSLHVPKYNEKDSWFAFPIVVKHDAPFSVQSFREHLDTHGVETRSIMCGNILDQKCATGMKFRSGDLSTTEHFARNGFLISCGHAYKEGEMQYIADTVKKFMDQKGA